jgi:hypothetical protein
MKHIRTALLFLSVIIAGDLFAQQPDSARIKGDTLRFVNGKPDSATAKKLDSTAVKKDTVARKKHSPQKAAIRSALVPGWGQVYNGKIWKVPIVYTALGIPAYLFVDNLKWYNKTKYAYAVVVSGTTNPDSLSKVDPELQPFVDRKMSNELLNYRNEFRRNVDYSVLFFLLAWGLNVIDASVDGHLKEFDVSPDLSFKIKPAFSPSGNTYGLSLVFDIHDGKQKLKSIGQ